MLNGKSFVAALAIAATASVASPALAQGNDAGGVYVGAETGVVMAGSGNLGGDAVVGQKAGFDLGGTVGYRFAQTPSGNFRVELEGHYSQSDLDTGRPYGAFAADAYNGEVQTAGAMVNAYYDLSQLGGRVVPYVGAGLGFENVDLDARGSAASYHGNDPVFAYQAIAGIEYRIDNHVSVTLDGRYFDMDKPRFHTAPAGIAVTPEPTASYDLDGFKGMVGVRYTF